MYPSILNLELMDDYASKLYILPGVLSAKTYVNVKNI